MQGNETCATARTAMAAAMLLLLVLAFYSLTLANPGFFNHDEWQKYDHVTSSGFLDFARQYGRLQAGPDFGYPVRPLGFLQQGFTSIWMGTRPIVPHLFDVLHHGLIALLCGWVLVCAGLSRRVALASAVVFAVSPLATVSTGWVGASFDRWYAGFFLVAAYGAVSLARGLGSRGGNCALIIMGMALALLSKETAVVLPGLLVMAVFAVLLNGRGGKPSLAAVFPQLLIVAGIAAIPLLAYLAIRWPALNASLHGEGGPYAPSLSNLPRNAALYFAQPFFFGAVELDSAVYLPRASFLVGGVFHAVLIGCFWKRYGLLNALLYVAAYFLFLLPVLPLHFAGAHYLYGSGLPFAAMVGLLLVPKDAMATTLRARAPLFAMAAIVALLGFRSLEIQLRMYDHGVCENRFLNSYLPEARDGMGHGARSVQVLVDQGAMGYVAERFLFGRRQFSASGALPTALGGPPDSGAARLRMGIDCRVRHE